MSKRLLRIVLVLCMFSLFSCQNSKDVNNLIDVEGVVQRKYRSESKLDLLDNNGKEWKIEFSFETPIYIDNEEFIYFENIEDSSELSISGYRNSEYEIKAKEAWLTKNEKEISESLSYKLFFNNTKFASKDNDCKEVFSVSRFIKGKRNMKGALKYNLVLTDLINGPSPDEVENSYLTSIPRNTSFNEIKVLDDGEKIVINFLNLDVNGSCNVLSAREQIEKTFYQFTEIKTVVIQLNGDESVVLQP
ncbi:MAG: GerMN domain-containing protein [Caldisericia bacterium]|nr:GerMN domain-containing protein [Caldisericia bacterium]